MTRALPGRPPARLRSASPGASSGPPRPRLILRLAVALLCAALVIAGVLTYLVVRHQDQQNSVLRPVGIPADVSTSTAELMRLSTVPGTAAPGFTLTDQNGDPLSLASLRGRVVVLTFNDPHCVDICPLVSQEFIDAYHDLGKEASRAVFLAVNVNPYFRTVGDVAAYSAEHQLTSVPSWRFLTGPLPALQSVWRTYGIIVQPRGRNADVLHTAEVLFIDPSGRERYIATPMADYTARGKAYLPQDTLAEWGQGIALITRHLMG